MSAPSPPSQSPPTPGHNNRQLSTNNVSSFSAAYADEEDDNLNNVGSSSALILVHDDDEDDHQFDFDSDAEEDTESSATTSQSHSSPPLSPTNVLLYMLSPSLKLGATLLPNTTLSLGSGIAALLFFASASAFCRQIWLLLGRHLGRKADLEEVVLDAFARKRNKETLRAVIRGTVRTTTIAFRVCLAAVYLREAVAMICPQLPSDLALSHTWALTLFLAVMLIPFLWARSLSWRRIVVITWLSIVVYIIWLIVVIVAHATGKLQQTINWRNRGILWQGITTTAFAFTSSGTLSLHATFKPRKTNPSKTRKARSSRRISGIAVLIATLLILPVSLLSVYPHHTLVNGVQISKAVPVLGGLTLVLGIPSILISTPVVFIPPRIRQTFSLSKVIVYIAFLLVALLPTAWSPIINNAILVSALAHTYLLPTFLHVVTYYLKRPRSLVVPSTPILSASPSNSSAHPASPGLQQDEMLMRKERAMQKRQFRKRIMWDIGVWVMLIPVSGGGLVWGAGKLKGSW